MPFALSQPLRPEVTEAIADLTVRGFVLATLFPIDLVTSVQLTGVALQNADVCLARAESLQTPGDLAGPLGVLARNLERVGSAVGPKLRTEVAGAAGDAAQPDPFLSLLLGSGRLLLDHTEFRSHLKGTLQASRPLIWLPSPLNNCSRGCVDLIQDVASVVHAQVAIAESEMGDTRTVEDLVGDLAFYLKPGAALPTPDTTRPAYIRSLACYLVQSAAELPRDVLLVFVDLRKDVVPEEWLSLLREVVRKIRNGNFQNRVRAILLGCDDVIGNGVLIRTHVGVVEHDQLKAEARSLLAATNIDPNDYDSLVDPLLADPIDLESVHEGVWSALEAARG
jgi:hypothetical protein